MNEHIHKYLDGELAREALDLAERAELARYEAAIAGAVAAVPVVVAPDLAPVVAARIAVLEAGAEAKAKAKAKAKVDRHWLWRPQPLTVHLRPAFAMAAAVVLAFWLGTRVGGTTGEPIAPLAAGAMSSQRVLVHFRLDVPNAQRVALAGDFTNWQPAHELREAAPGVWTVIVPLEAGVHDYAFVVDGERWVSDPLAPPVADGFGGTNSRLAVLLPEGSSSL